MKHVPGWILAFILVATALTLIPHGIRVVREHLKPWVQYCRDPFTGRHAVIRCADIEP